MGIASESRESFQGLGTKQVYRHWIHQRIGQNLPLKAGMFYNSLVRHLCVSKRPENGEEKSWCRCGRKYIIWKFHR